MSFLVLIILFLSYLFVRYLHNWRPDPWPINSFKLPDFQIHRGYWTEGLQENTLEAFREAAKRGYMMVELDVQLSKDGVPVVFHDDNLKRLAHRSDNVNDLSHQELKSLANAPSLEEVLIDSSLTPFINIEIKSRSVKDQRTALKVVEIIKKFPANKIQNRIIFSSFNPITLRVLWKHLPEIPRALLATNDTTDPDSRIYLRKFWLGGLAHAHMLNLEKKMITPQLMKRLQERKIPVAAWTVNDRDMASLLRNKGVISIITDKP